MIQKNGNLLKFITPDKGYNYLVEECDIFYGHIDHPTIGNFNSFDEAKKCADEHQKQAPYYFHYTVFDVNGDEVYCALPVRSGWRNNTNYPIEYEKLTLKELKELDKYMDKHPELENDPKTLNGHPIEYPTPEEIAFFEELMSD